MYDAYIFDLDGTLLDTLEDLADSVNYALKKHGLPMRTVEEVRIFVGNGVRKLIERAVGNANAEIDAVLSDFKSYYGEHGDVKTKPYDGIKELLFALKNLGKKIAIVSNKMDSAVKSLAKIYFDGLIDVAIGENEEGGVQKKPAPDSVLLALKALKTNNAVYIGDSEVDIQTAFNAHLPCLCVTWGFREDSFLKEQGGGNFVHTPQEILGSL